MSAANILDAVRTAGRRGKGAPGKHPADLGGTGLMTTLIHGLRRTGGRSGLQTMCESGGIASITIVELL